MVMSLVSTLNLRYLIGVRMSVIVILNILIATVQSFPSDTFGAGKVPTCSTQGCKDAAKLIRDNINETENPCNNFYNFACGGFIKNSIIPKNKYIINHFEGVKQKVLQEIEQTLKTETDPTEPRIFKLVKNYYKACTDERTIKNRGLSPLLGYVDKLGGWPVIVGNAWNESSFDIFETDYKLRKIGYKPKSIFNIIVYNDLLNTSRNYLYIKPAETEVKAEFFKRGFWNNVIQAYYTYMVDIAVLLGANKTRADSDLKKVLELEKELTLAVSVTNIIKGINLRKIKDLEKQAPFVPWSTYINGITQPIYQVKNETIVNLYDPGYLKKLENILKTTSKRVLANYMIWKFIAESVPYLTDEFRDKLFKFTRKSSQNSTPMHRKSRSEECIDLLTDKNSGLMVGVSTMYTRKYFTNDTKQDVKQIVSSIINAFKHVLRKVSWLDDASKAAAERKSEFMRRVIGYPDELLSDKTIDDYSSDLDLYPNDHFGNFLNLQRFRYDYSLTGLNSLTNESLWTVFADSTTVNAYYNNFSNTFVILAALLQPPLFNSKWPNYAKYGSIGFIIGHEIMHGFDSTRVLFDYTGSLNAWISINSLHKYDTRNRCLREQYGNFTDERLGLHVDGKLTLNENLADNGGVKLAYTAYIKWVNKYGKDLELPGLKYTPDQLFWITSMNMLCSKDTPEHRKDSFKSNHHTPDNFRSLGLVSNSFEFAHTFNCPEGSPMNPVNKCELW